METYQDVFALFLMGLAAIVALLFTIAASAVLLGASVKASRWVTAIDHNPAMVNFGNTVTGQYLYNQVASLIPKIDSADDKLIKELAQLPMLKQLYTKNIITEDVFRSGVSKLLSESLGVAAGFLDGKESPPPDFG